MLFIISYSLFVICLSFFVLHFSGFAFMFVSLIFTFVFYLLVFGFYFLFFISHFLLCGFYFLFSDLYFLFPPPYTPSGWRQVTDREGAGPAAVRGSRFPQRVRRRKSRQSASGSTRSSGGQKGCAALWQRPGGKATPWHI